MTNTFENPQSTMLRKQSHIDICANNASIDSAIDSFEKYTIEHQALPEISLEEVSLQAKFLNNYFDLPFLITGMTGGVEHGHEINRILAACAVQANIPMGIGSQKVALKSDKSSSFFSLRKEFPKLFLIGNLGAVNLNYGVTVSAIQKLVDVFELNAFALHLNPLQECIQPEGETNFNNLLPKIEAICKAISVPIVVKEVGNGISASVYTRLVSTGVSAIDIGGKGGTNWALIEGARGSEYTKRLGCLFANWGITTADSLQQCVMARAQLSQKSSVEIIATGGIRNGVQAAKALGMGANMVGVGLSLFKAAYACDSSAFDKVNAELLYLKKALQIAMFCSGSKTIKEIRVKAI